MPKAQPKAEDQIHTAETVAIAKFVEPIRGEVGLSVGLSAFGDGAAVGDMRCHIYSDQQYDHAGVALVKLRSNRKAMKSYFKDQPSAEKLGPGQGLCYFTRQAWEAANSLYNRLDEWFGDRDTALESGMKDYRKRVEEQARLDAEAKAQAERERLEAEAAKQRKAAEVERKRLEAIAEAERKKAEIARQKQLAAEQAAAKTIREAADAKRRAEAERRRIEQEAEAKVRAAAERERQAKAEADAKQLAAQNVQPAIEREAPRAQGVQVAKVWKARVIGWDDDKPADPKHPEIAMKNLLLLAQAVIAGEALIEWLRPNTADLNSFAKLSGASTPVPGVEFYQEDITRTRR